MRFLLLILLVLNSFSLTFGQIAPQTQRVGPITQASQQNQETWKRQQESLINDSESKLRSLNENGDNSEIKTGFYLTEPRLSKEQKLLITPTKDEISQHSVFLKQPKTGIFRIIQTPDCGNKLVVDVRDEQCLSRNNLDLSYYSFRKRLYANLAWADLRYTDKTFLVGFERRTIGLIQEIGDIPIESLSRDNKEIKELSEIKMPKEEALINKKKEEIRNGVKIGEAKFFDTAEVKINKTYLLRSYSYRTSADALNDRRIDVIIAFKVIRIDADNNLTIIWKELSKEDSYKI